MEQAGPVMGNMVDIDPHEALLLCVRIAAGEVAYSSMRVHELEREDAVGNPISVKGKPGMELEVQDGEVVEVGMSLVEEVTHHTPELNIWIRTRQVALDRLAKFSKMALDAGVAERQVRLAERYGQQIADVLEQVLRRLKLSTEQKKLAPAVIREALTAIEAGG